MRIGDRLHCRGGARFIRDFWDPANQLPCQQPPWAHLIAINANTGDIAWKVPLGTSDEMEAKGIHNTGSFGQGGAIATAGGLVLIGGTIDGRFRAFESKTGKTLWETKAGCRSPHQSDHLYGSRQAVCGDCQFGCKRIFARVRHVIE